MAQLGYDEHSPLGKVGRKQETLHSVDSLHITTSKSPWTSARCNRLLRPLSSKIALLRKERQFETKQNEQESGLSGALSHGSTNTPGAVNKDEGSGNCRRAACLMLKDAAGEWETSPRPSKKLRRTYSSRAKITSTREEANEDVGSQSQDRPSCTVIGLPTELSLEARSDGTVRLSEKIGEVPGHVVSETFPPRDLPKYLAPSNWKLVDGICKGFVALLKATHIRTPISTKGCRSLLSTCLTQIPEYIAEEEILAKIDDPDTDVDVSNLVYNDLEEFGSMPGGGWEPLRQVVRAHGIKMITNAIEEGLLGLQVSRHLFHLCLDVSAAGEAQYIIESLTRLTERGDETSPTSTKEPPLNLHMIINSMGSLASRFGKSGFLHRHTAAMLDKGILTVDWISSKAMIGTWNDVIRSITQNDSDAQSATLLLQTAIAVSCQNTSSMLRPNVHDVRLRIRKSTNRPTLRSTKNDQAINNMASSQPLETAISKSSDKDIKTSSNLRNVLSALSAIARLQSQGSLHTKDQLCTWVATILHDIALEAVRAIELWSEGNGCNRLGASNSGPLCLSLLAASLTELLSIEFLTDVSEQCVPSLTRLAELLVGDEIMKDAGPFICAVARCCGRAKSEDAFDVIKIIVQELTMASRVFGYSRSIQKLCKDLALAAAFTYSSDTSRPVHLDWALQVELDLTGKGSFTPRPAAVKTPVRGNARNKGSFRWEEGICEWIAKTPNLLLQKPAVAKSDNDHDTDWPRALSIEVKQALPSLPEMSPCRMKKAAKIEPGNRESGEVKALHVLIPIGGGRRGEDGSGRQSSSCSIVTQPCKRSLRSRLKQNIYENNGRDQESLSRLSQEESLALATLDGAPSSKIGFKRKRQSEKEQKSDRASNPYHAPSKLHPEEIDQDPEMGDIDELALLFP